MCPTAVGIGYMRHILAGKTPSVSGDERERRPPLTKITHSSWLSVCVELGVRTKSCINMAVPRELEVTRLTKESRTRRGG